jgi:MFS family permease
VGRGKATVTANTDVYLQEGNHPDTSGTIKKGQWLALLSALLGWLFDSMDLNLFTLILFPSVAQLTKSSDPAAVAQIGGYIVAIKLFCWGIGGIVFGILADRYGRARIMIVTIILYAAFTGLSGLARTWQELALLQAIAGLGIGGEWAAGAALVAETWPMRHRAKAMQAMQFGFVLGFFLAALDNLLLGPVSWRWVLAAGALPVLIVFIIRRYVQEPDRWLRARNEKHIRQISAFSRVSAIFSPSLRTRTIVGLSISAAMMIGSWGGLTLMPSWIQQMIREEGNTAITGIQAVSYAFMLMMAGAALAYILLIFLIETLGRRKCYFLFALGSLATTLFLFTFVKSFSDLVYYVPLYGFFVIGGFGTFAAYLPEIFPTRVRTTGQGFCWNAARCLTAIGPLIGSALVTNMGSFQAAASSTSAFFIIGMIAIWWGPETRGLELED